MKKYIYSLLFIPVLLLSCKSVDENTFANFNEAPLFGMIYDSESLPVAGAELVLDDEHTALTDINGRVLFSTVSRGEHDVVIRKEGFEEARMVLNFSNRDQVLYSTLISLQDILDKLASSLGIGRIDEAGLFLDRALLIDPKDIRLKYLKVVYLCESEEYSDALGEIGLLRKIYPDDSYLVMTQANILFYGFKEKMEAVELLKEFSQLYRNEDFENLIEKMSSEIDAERGTREITGENYEQN